MAASLRKQIRDAVKAALIAAGDFGATVYIGRRDSIPAKSLPAACVYLNEEQIEYMGKATPDLRRYAIQQEISVECYARQTAAESAEEEMDVLRDATITAVMADTTLGGSCKDINPTGSGPDINAEGNVNYGVIVVQFEAYLEITI